MARGRVLRPEGEFLPDELRCTCSAKGWRCFERRRNDGATCEFHHTLSRCRRRRWKVISTLTPSPPLKPLNFYRRRKRFQFRPGPARDLQPDTPSLPPEGVPSSPSPCMEGPLNATEDNSRERLANSDNQNPSSVVEDSITANAGTKEGTPISSVSGSALPNYVANPGPDANPNWFQKTPSIWKAVEKLEVFGQTPQRPHFMKLQR